MRWGDGGQPKNLKKKNNHHKAAHVYFSLVFGCLSTPLGQMFLFVVPGSSFCFLLFPSFSSYSVGSSLCRLARFVLFRVCLFFHMCVSCGLLRWPSFFMFSGWPSPPPCQSFSTQHSEEEASQRPLLFYSPNVINSFKCRLLCSQKKHFPIVFGVTASDQTCPKKRSVYVPRNVEYGVWLLPLCPSRSKPRRGC